MAVVWAITLAKFVLHIYFNNRYGYFRDQFDYIDCANTSPGDMLIGRR